MIIKIPEPISGGLLLSYKCSARCDHCMYACSSQWNDWISEGDLEKILSQLGGRIRPSPYGTDNVSLNYGLHFTGGEPFLNFELLVRAVEISRELGIPSTFVETNCFWCVNDEITRENLETLRNKGLKGVLISVNPYYLEYVPFERTDRGVRLSQEVFNKNVMVYQSEYYVRFKKSGIKEKIPLKDYLGLIKKEDLAENVELFLMGRAAYRLKDLYPAYPAHAFFREPCRPPFLRNWHNHFDNYGNYLPGYCGGISLGDCRNLDNLLKDGINTDEYPVLKSLITKDFEGLLHFARDLHYQEARAGYISKCHLCVDIRKYLRAEGQFKELKPEEFYNQLK